jgi:putative MATE family efflux protein
MSQTDKRLKQNKKAEQNDIYDQSFLLQDTISPKEANREVLKLAAPALAENVMMSLIGMADMIMVGRIGSAAIAAVGLSNQPMMFSMALFMALNVGTTAVVARHIGATEYKEANETARQTLVLVGLMGIITSAILFFFAEEILLFMGAEQDTMAHAMGYFRIVSISMIFNTIQMSVNSMVRGAGDTKSPMANNMVVNIVNLVGNFVLINGIRFFPRLGVTGAGLATAFSRLVGAVLALTLVLVPGKRITVSFKERFRFNWDIAARVTRVGIPSAIEQFVMRAGMMFFTRTVSGLGTVTYAAHQVGLNITSLSFTTGMGFAMAATSLVGRSLGAKKPDHAEVLANSAHKLAMMISGVVAFFLFFFGKQVSLLYSNEIEVLTQAAIALRIIALVQPAQSTQFVLAGALRGAGDTKWPLYSTIIGVWGFRVLLSYILVQKMGFGLIGAWIAMAIDQVARSSIILYRFKTGKWKETKI